MKKIGLLGAVALMFVAGAALADGAAIFNAKCAMCHGAGKKWQAKASAACDNNVKNGVKTDKGAMPAIKISDGERAEVCKYWTDTFK